MTNKTSTIIKSLFFLSILCVFFNTQTQSAYAQVRSVDIVTNVSPENPKPYEDVNISLESYSTDLNKALIEWKGGDKTFLKNLGATDFSFKMGGLGTQAIIDIKIITAEGDTIQKRAVIAPSDMDMLWQAVDSHVPPFYRGKALPAKEGAIKIIALPGTSKGIQTSGMTFNWKLNDTTDQSQSGYKKSVFKFNLSNTEIEDKVEVRATSTGDNTSTGNKMIFSGTDPFLIFYRKSPSEGVLYNRALPRELNMTEEQMTVYAEPYFMSNLDDDNANTYAWKINGTDIDTPANKRELSVRPTARGGYAKINIEIENIQKLFQKVSQVLTLDL